MYLSTGSSDKPRTGRGWCANGSTTRSSGKRRVDASGAIEFWDTTNQQDWQVSQPSQAGISSRVYAPGLYSALESMVAAWDRE